MVKVKPDGSGLAYAGFLAGSNSDDGAGIAVDGVGATYVTGETYSSDFPTVGGLGAAALKGWSDAFVAKVKPDGSGLTYASFLGGSDGDYGYGIAVDSAGAAYVVGNTSSNDFPVVGGPDISHNGDADVFVVKIVETAAPTPPIAVIDHCSAGYGDPPLAVVAPGVLLNDLRWFTVNILPILVDCKNRSIVRKQRFSL